MPNHAKHAAKVGLAACISAAAILSLAVIQPSPAFAAKAGEAGNTNIVLNGEAVDTHDFTAYKIADYTAEVYNETTLSVNSELRSLGFATVAGSNVDAVTLPDGSRWDAGTTSTSDTSFKQALTQAVARIDGGSPTIGAGYTTINGIDPLEFVAQQWQSAETSQGAWQDSSDPLKGGNARTRQLGDWLNGLNLAASGFNLTAVSATGTSSAATLATDEGLHFVKSTDASSTTGPLSLGIIIGTEAHYQYGGSTDGYSDLYDTSGNKTQDLGAVNVKGDLIGAAKSVGTNAMDDYTPAVGDAVSFKITATIPKYPSYPAANDSVDGDGDYSDTGEVAPLIFVLEESYGTDFADPTHTVVVTGVKVGAGTTLSTSSTSDGTAALTDANYVNNAMASGDYVVYVDTTNNKLYVQLTDVTIRAHGGESLEIAYSLTMTGTTSHGTVVGSDNVTPNKATTSSAIVFTDNPYDVAITNHETTAAISTTLNSFNFSTTVKDIASLAAKPGAKFKVYKGAGTATGVTFGTGSNGVYTVTGTSATPTEVEVHTDGTLQLKGLAGDQLYRIELSAPATDYLTNNTDQVKFYVYIDAERSALNSAGSLNAAAFNFGKIDGGNPTISDTVASGTAQANIFSSGYAYGEPLSLYLLLDTDASGTSDVSSDGNTVIYNAKTSSDIPFTGGNILTYLIIAFAFGIAATVFAIGAVRRSRNKR